jgi:hypothetical protein
MFGAGLRFLVGRVLGVTAVPPALAVLWAAVAVTAALVAVLVAPAAVWAARASRAAGALLAAFLVVAAAPAGIVPRVVARARFRVGGGGVVRVLGRGP